MDRDICMTRERPIKGTSHCEIFGSLFGGGGDQEITNRTEPPDWLKPHLQFSLGQARSLYDRPLNWYGDELPVPIQEAYTGLYDAMGRSPLVGPATQYAQDVLEGNFLQGDALRNAAAPAIQQAMGGVNSLWGGAGGTGSGIGQQMMAQGVTNAMAPVYQAERGRQQQMAGMAPGMEAFRLSPMTGRLGLLNQWSDAQNQIWQEPWTKLGMFNQGLGAIGPMAGSTSTRTIPGQDGGGFGKLLGLGLSAAGMFTGNPMMAMAGQAAGSVSPNAYGGLWGASPNSSWGSWGV